MLDASWFYVLIAYGATFVILGISWELAMRRYRLARRQLQRKPDE